jgi:hypothetical protein
MSIAKITPPRTAAPVFGSHAAAPVLSAAEIDRLIADLLAQEVVLEGPFETVTRPAPLPSDLLLSHDPDDDDEYEADEDSDEDDDDDFDDEDDDIDDDDEGDFDEDDYADEEE